MPEEEELVGILIAATVDGLIWLLFRSLRSGAEKELRLLTDCAVAGEGRPARDLLRQAGLNELPCVALSGTLAPQSPDEVVARNGQRCIAFMEKHAQIAKDGTVRKVLFTESRVPHMVAVRRLGSWTLGMTGPTEERINLRNVQSARGFDRLFRRHRDHRVPLEMADGRAGDYFHITESVIPAGLVLNFMGALSYDPISQQLHMRLLEVGFTDMNELLDSAKSSVSLFRFFGKVCLFTTAGLLALAAHRAYKIYARRALAGQSPPTPPTPPAPPAADQRQVGDGSGLGQGQGQVCGICFDRQPNTVLVDCGHALCGQCAASVTKCPFCSVPKRRPPVQVFVP